MSNAVVNGLAGAGGGIIAQIITYPLQSVNTRQQTERIAKKSRSQGSSGGGTLVQILQVIKSEGIGGLYSGLKPSLLGTATSQGIYYYFYQVFKNKAESIAAANKRKGRGDGTVGMFSWLVVAALAGSLNVLFTNPIWVLVTRMQTHTQAEQKILEAKKEALLRESSSLGSLHDKLRELDSMKPNPYGTLHAAYEVYKEAGILGFWKGIIPTMIMVCNPSIQFMIYESSIKHLKAKRADKKQNSTKITALEVFLIGAIAKLGATVTTYPLLVVKSRLQAKQEISTNNSLRYSGTLDAIVKMIHYEGLSSFYKGMSTKIVQSVFAASVLFMIKEELVNLFSGIYYYFYQVFKNKAESIAAANKRKGRGDGTVGMFSWLVVAALSGSLNVLFTNPIWVLVTRMQTHTQAEQKIMEAKKEALLRESSSLGSLHDKLRELDSMKPNPYGTLHAAYEVYKEAGILGFWKGIIPTMIMVCNPSIQFMIYESSIKHLKAKRADKKQNSTKITALEVFLIGAIAKLGATVTTYPLLVVKSRLQAKQEISTNNSLRYSGTLDAIVKMIHYEGLSSFYKGMSTKIVQSVFAASVLFMIKEELVNLFSVLLLTMSKSNPHPHHIK